MTHPANKPDPYAALRPALRKLMQPKLVERTCCDCGHTGPEESFQQAPGFHPDGRRRRVPRCTPCHRAYRSRKRRERANR